MLSTISVQRLSSHHPCLRPHKGPYFPLCSRQLHPTDQPAMFFHFNKAPSTSATCCIPVGGFPPGTSVDFLALYALLALSFLMHELFYRLCFWGEASVPSTRCPALFVGAQQAGTGLWDLYSRVQGVCPSSPSIIWKRRTLLYY